MRSRMPQRLMLFVVAGALLLAAPGCTFSLLDLSKLLGGGGTPEVTVGGTGATPTPVPVAQVTFQVGLPGPLNPGETLAITLLDEVTGLPFNAVSYPLQPLDAQTYGVILPLPIDAVVRYRYILTGTRQAQEDTGLDQPVRYRLLQVTNTGTVTDVIASWSDRPFSGEAGILVGKALNADTGAPIPDLFVSYGGQQTLTDSTGTFKLAGLPSGTYNLVLYAMDGSYQVFQQGARIEKDHVTPVEVRLRQSQMVSVTFLATLPDDTIVGAPVRLAGNLWQLGNTFSDLRGGMNGVADRMPVLTRQSDGRYSVTLALPAGAALEYKYTMGDGFWNAEHKLDGTFQVRRLIIPAVNTIVQDSVASWQDGPGSGPILFEATVPANTPASDIVYIQFNPYNWTEPVPMWPAGGNRWTYRLYGPMNLLSSFGYRYCRNAQCGIADDVATTGADVIGRRATTSFMPQDLQDTVSAWNWLQTTGNTSLTGATIPARVSFVSGIEFAPVFSPDYYAFTPQALSNVQAIGANWAILTPTWTFSTPSPLSFYFKPGTDPLWSDTGLQVGQARALGLNVALFPQPVFPFDRAEWWRSAPRDAGWWQAWFEDYRRFALEYADLASQRDAQVLILGGDWVMPALPGGKLADGQSSGVPDDAEARWRVLLGDIRARFRGQIWWAWPYSAGGFVNAPSLLREVDATYILFALPYPQQTGTGRDAIIAATGQALDNEVLPFAAALQKPVILAFAVPSANASGAVDLTAQLESYEGIFTAVNQRSWISGVVSRGYFLPVILHDTSTSVHGKPTADLLWYWLASLRGVQR